jgi:hypothetical protein
MGINPFDQWGVFATQQKNGNISFLKAIPFYIVHDMY